MLEERIKEVIDALKMYDVKVVDKKESCLNVSNKKYDMLIWVDEGLHYENCDEDSEDITTVNTIEDLKAGIKDTFEMLEQVELKEYREKQLIDEGHERLDYEKYMCDKMHEDY